MKFSFDELYAEVNTDGSLTDTDFEQEAEYTFVGDADDGLQLRLPKLYTNGNDDELDVSSGDTLSLEDVVDEATVSALSSLSIALQKNALPVLSLNYKPRNWEAQDRVDSLPNSEKLVDTVEPFWHHTDVSVLEKAWDTTIDAVDRQNQTLIKSVKEEKQRREQERIKAEAEAKKRAEAEQRRKLEEDQKSKQEADRKQKEEAELQRKKLEAQKAEELKARKEEEEREKNKTRESAESTDFKSINDSFHKYKHMIQTIKTQIVEPVKQNPTLKKVLAQHKRKINPKFGQLTNSVSQLSAITNELTSLVDQTKSEKLAYDWILNFISKAIVSQAEAEARVKPDSALPLARLAINLLVLYPELKELLLARMIKKCPFVIGYTCSIGTEEGRLRMGWKRQSDNKWEEDISYDERMGGIITLFAVLTRLPLPPQYIESHKHPFPISWSWRMLARIGNTPNELLTNTHFVILACWWEAAGAHLLSAYKKQAVKLLKAISLDLTDSVASKRFVGAARLRILSEEWENTNCISSFPEMVA